jgi:hypothetical protein
MADRSGGQSTWYAMKEHRIWANVIRILIFCLAVLMDVSRNSLNGEIEPSLDTITRKTLLLSQASEDFLVQVQNHEPHDFTKGLHDKMYQMKRSIPEPTEAAIARVGARTLSSGHF